MKEPSSNPAAEFERDGFFIAPDLMSAEECDILKTEARKVLDEHAKPGSSVYVHVAAVSGMYRDLAEDKRLMKILRPVMPQGVMFLSDKIVYKSSQKTFPTPPHVDCFYWPNTRPKLSVWIPLDDATAESGTLTVVPGSHQREWTMKNRPAAAGEFRNAIEAGGWADNDIVTCAIKRGTAIIFSDRLVHASTVNTAGKDRYAIISTYHAPSPDENFDLNFPARKVLVPAPPNAARS